MAYVSQDLKAKLAPTIKEICKRYGVKATIAVRNHSTLVLNIKEGQINFIDNLANTVGKETDLAKYVIKDQSIDVNPYHYRNHFSGVAKWFLEEVINAMNDGNWDRSDIMTDYFDKGWYIDVNIGRWNRPYVCTGNF
jgi:hypothetical protein